MFHAGTVGMKGVLERLVSQGHSRLAALAPIYGATEKLLEYLANGKKVSEWAITMRLS